MRRRRRDALRQPREHVLQLEQRHVREQPADAQRQAVVGVAQRVAAGDGAGV